MSATDRVLLVRHAPSSETRRGAFPAVSGAHAGRDGEHLDGGGRSAAQELGVHLPPAARCLSSHAARARQTAEAAGLAPDADADLAECDFGAWAGRTPADLTDDPGLGAWYADPDEAPHGGERLSDVRARAAAVLARAAEGTTVAFTHGGFVKAAVLEVLGLPATAVWQIDVAPASITELHRTSGHWRVVRLNWTPSVRVPIGTAG